MAHLASDRACVALHAELPSFNPADFVLEAISTMPAGVRADMNASAITRATQVWAPREMTPAPSVDCGATRRLGCAQPFLTPSLVFFHLQFRLSHVIDPSGNRGC